MAYINGTEVLFSPRIGAGVSVDEIRELFFPVGIVISCDTSPASFLGGAWEQIKDKFLLAAGDTYAHGTTGGEATHTLTEIEMPSHTHNPIITTYYGGDAAQYRSLFATNKDFWGYDENNAVSYTGGSQPHNNMPPYLAQNTWKRIA